LFRDLGFGRMTGVDLRDEADFAALPHEDLRDYVPSPDHPRDFTLLATPLQWAVAIAAIANGGVLYQPRIVDRVLAPDGAVVHRTTPVVRSRISIPSCAREHALDAIARSPLGRTVAFAPALDPELVVVAALHNDGLGSPFGGGDSASTALAVVRAWHDAHSSGDPRP
jgi:cell division protein FtsI/penicillin-binding protein 2